MDRVVLENIGKNILDSALTVHKELGPGLLESAYRVSLRKELELRGFLVKEQVAVELTYKSVPLGKTYVIDLLVEDEIIIEVKACESITPVFMAQLITYLKLYKRNLGYLINFHVPLLKDGFKRVVYRL
jgi:GxxExxY protein